MQTLELPYENQNNPVTLLTPGGQTDAPARLVLPAFVAFIYHPALRPTNAQTNERVESELIAFIGGRPSERESLACTIGSCMAWYFFRLYRLERNVPPKFRCARPTPKSHPP